MMRRRGGLLALDVRGFFLIVTLTVALGTGIVIGRGPQSLSLARSGTAAAPGAQCPAHHPAITPTPGHVLDFTGDPAQAAIVHAPAVSFLCMVAPQDASVHLDVTYCTEAGDRPQQETRLPATFIAGPQNMLLVYWLASYRCHPAVAADSAATRAKIDARVEWLRFGGGFVLTLSITP